LKLPLSVFSSFLFLALTSITIAFSNNPSSSRGVSITVLNEKLSSSLEYVVVNFHFASLSSLRTTTNVFLTDEYAILINLFSSTVTYNGVSLSSSKL
jgi:hypothetical protein